MSLKIGPVQMAGIQRYNEVTKKPVKSAEVRQETDKVDVSGSSRLFAQALEAAKAAPEVRAERVDAIRTAVQNGTYQIDSQRIAARILGL